jgi:hypothetical protein
VAEPRVSACGRRGSERVTPGGYRAADVDVVNVPYKH